jgi:hypothetical protein
MPGGSEGKFFETCTFFLTLCNIKYNMGKQSEKNQTVGDHRTESQWVSDLHPLLVVSQTAGLPDTNNRYEEAPDETDFDSNH